MILEVQALACVTESLTRASSYEEIQTIISNINISISIRTTNNTCSFYVRFNSNLSNIANLYNIRSVILRYLNSILVNLAGKVSPNRNTSSL